jgi:hypothetical protein
MLGEVTLLVVTARVTAVGLLEEMRGQDASEA